MNIEKHSVKITSLSDLSVCFQSFHVFHTRNDTKINNKTRTQAHNGDNSNETTTTTTESPPKNVQKPLLQYLLGKTIEGYCNSFDYITFEKINYKLSIFVIDGTTDLQFIKMQNEIYGSLVMIQ